MRGWEVIYGSHYIHFIFVRSPSIYSGAVSSSSQESGGYWIVTWMLAPTRRQLKEGVPFEITNVINGGSILKTTFNYLWLPCKCGIVGKEFGSKTGD